MTICRVELRAIEAIDLNLDLMSAQSSSGMCDLMASLYPTSQSWQDCDIGCPPETFVDVGFGILHHGRRRQLVSHGDHGQKNCTRERKLARAALKSNTNGWETTQTRKTHILYTGISPAEIHDGAPAGVGVGRYDRGGQFGV